MRPKHLLGLLLGIGILSTSVLAEEGGTTAQYLWTKETTVETNFQAQLGFGLLDGSGITGGRGTPVLNYFAVNYAITPDLGMVIGLPLAGTLSSGNDSYGIGNILLGGRYIVPLDRLAVGAGIDLALPTAQSDAVVGTATRPYVLFLTDTFGLSPYFVVSYIADRLTFTADLGADLRVATNSVGDRLENSIFYDAAVAMSLYQNIWATVEFNAYTTTSFASNVTALFAGPGIRYQDHEISLGFHFAAPFRSPAKKVIDFAAIFDFRVTF